MPSSPENTESPALTARMIHVSMIAGPLLFAGAAPFMRRTREDAPAALSRASLFIMAGAAVAACALAMVLRQRIPTRSREMSPDLFWPSVSSKAILTWAPLEAAGLFALAQFFATSDPIALGVAALPMALLAYLNPWVLERA